MVGYVHLWTTFGDEKGSKSIMIKYLIVDARISCTQFKIGTIIPTPHITMKWKDHLYPSRPDYSKRMLYCKPQNWQREKGDKAQGTTGGMHFPRQQSRGCETQSEKGRTTSKADKRSQAFPNQQRAILVHQTRMPDEYRSGRIHSPSGNNKCRYVCIMRSPLSFLGDGVDHTIRAFFSCFSGVSRENCNQQDFPNPSFPKGTT